MASCADVRCGPEERCADGRCVFDECPEGACLASCEGVECMGSAVCVDGRCVDDPCATARCPPGERCIHDAHGLAQCEPAWDPRGPDMAVPDERLEDVVALYRSKLEATRLEHVIFGHVGDNHLHVNILPRSERELEEAKALYEVFAREVVAMGGSVSAEHGIGRIKKSLLLLQYGREKVEQMRAIKEALDPRGLLNPGVLF